MGESDENHSSCVSDWQCTKHEFMNSPLEAEFPCSAAAFRKSSLNPCSTRSCAAEHWSMSCLQLRHVPGGSATPGTKMFLTCQESYAALRMNRGVCICFTSFWGKKHSPGGKVEVHEEGKFFAEPCVVTTSLKKAAMYPTPATSFSLMKKPASERHLTLALGGRRS